MPLKDISAHSMAEAMIEVFSRTNIPWVLLTVQESQFLSCLLKQLYSRLTICHIKTSPYHPQSNGVLERMHGTISSMLIKYIHHKCSWPMQVKLCLFVLHGMPHEDSGYTPFELVFGRCMQLPLSLLFHSLLEESESVVNLTEWMKEFEKRVEVVGSDMVSKMNRNKRKEE